MFAHVAEDVHDQQQEEARDRGSGHAGLDLGPEPFLVLAESSPLGFRPPKSGSHNPLPLKAKETRPSELHSKCLVVDFYTLVLRHGA